MNPEAAPYRKLNLTSDEEVSMNALVDTLWPAGESGIISGDPEVGKTWFAFEEAICLAMGWPVLGEFKVRERKRVLFIEEEAETRGSALMRVKGILRAHGVDWENRAVRQELDEWFTLVAFPGLRLFEANDVARLGATIKANRAQVVYLDSFFRMMPGKEISASGPVTLALGHLDMLTRDYGVTFRLLHHTNKAGDSLYGSQAMTAWRRDGLHFGDLLAGGITTVRYEGNNAAKNVLGRVRLEFAGPNELVRIALVQPGQEKLTLTKSEKLALPVLVDAWSKGITVFGLVERAEMPESTARFCLERFKKHGLAESCGSVKVGKTTAEAYRATTAARSLLSSILSSIPSGTTTSRAIVVDPTAATPTTGPSEPPMSRKSAPGKDQRGPDGAARMPVSPSRIDDNNDCSPIGEHVVLVPEDGGRAREGAPPAAASSTSGSRVDPPAPGDDDLPLRLGAKVHHTEWGLGLLVGIEREDGDVIATVHFKVGGRRQVAIEHLEEIE